MKYKRYSLEESDFKLFKDFPLSWRFTEQKYNILPQDILDKIKPLNESKTSMLYKEFVSIFWHDYSLNKHKAEIISKIDIENSNEIEVEKWLKNIITNSVGKIVIYWIHPGGADTSLITEADVFCDYWDDFYYGSDEILIWPVTENWLIHLFHHGVIYFAKIKQRI